MVNQAAAQTIKGRHHTRIFTQKFQLHNALRHLRRQYRKTFQRNRAIDHIHQHNMHRIQRVWIDIFCRNAGQHFPRQGKENRVFNTIRRKNISGKSGAASIALHGMTNHIRLMPERIQRCRDLLANNATGSGIISHHQFMFD